MCTNKIDIDTIAELAMLHLDQNSREAFEKDIDQIVDMFSELDCFSCCADDTCTMSVSADEMREDVLADSLPSEKILLNATRNTDGYFCVPQALEVK